MTKRGFTPLQLLRLWASGWRQGAVSVLLTILAIAPYANGDSKQDLVVWNMKLLGPEVGLALHRFELEHPQYRVISSSAVSTDSTSDNQRLLSAIAGGVPPDVVVFDRFAIGEWAARGSLTDLNPYLDAQTPQDPYRIDRADYFPWTLDEASYHQPGSASPPALYGIPCSIDVRVLFSNANHLRQAGIIDHTTGQPLPPRTWEELRTDARKLTLHAPNGTMTRLGFGPNYGNSWLYLYVFEAGGNLLDPTGTHATIDTPPVMRALRFMTDIYDDLGGAGVVNGFQSKFATGIMDPFINGQVSMKIDSSGSLQAIADWAPQMDFIVSPAPMPADRLAAGVQPVTWAGGWSLVIPSTCSNKAGAFALLQFLSSPQSYRFIEQANRESAAADGRLYLPTLVANRKAFEPLVKQWVFDDPTIPPNIRHAFEVFEQLLPHTMIRPPSPVGQLLWNEHISAYDAATNHVYAGTEPNEDAEIRHCLAIAQSQVQSALDRFLSPPPPYKVNWPGYFAAYALLICALAGAGVIAFRRNRKTHGYHEREVGAALLFASPWLIGMICLVGGPILFSIVLSFSRYDVLSDARYVGLQNYREILSDPTFYRSVLNTAVMVIRLPLVMIAGLAIALLLNQKVRGLGVYRTAFFIPSIVPIVAASILWFLLLSPSDGPINGALRWLIATPPAHLLEWIINRLLPSSGGPFHFTAPDWLQSRTWSKPSLIVMSVWSAGGGMIIWLAGLQSIPQQLYEAAEIDGAGPWRRFMNVTLPMLSPYIFFNTVIGLIGTMQIFVEAFVMTRGGPADSTLFYAYYLFREGFQYFRMGYASALAWILFLIVLGLTLLQLAGSRRWVHYDRA